MPEESPRRLGREQIQAFWQAGLAELAQVPIDAKVEEDPSRSGRDFMTSAVSLLSLGEVRIRGWYSIPRYHSGRRGVSAVVATPGYDGIKEIPIHVVAMGYAVLTIFPRGQGESEQEWQVDTGTTKLTHGVTDPWNYYYRGAYLDCVRGIDFLCSREEVDAGRLGMWGRSQGGAFGLTTASLDSRVSAVVAEQPFLSDFPTAIREAGSAYEELREHIAQHPNEQERTLRTLEYFDVATLADAIACPTLINLGKNDNECLPSTVRKAFENLTCLKALVEFPELDHEPCTDFNVHAMNWLHRYLG